MAISNLWGQVGSYAGSPGADAWRQLAESQRASGLLPFKEAARRLKFNIAQSGQRGQGVAMIPESQLAGQQAASQAAGESALLGQAMGQKFSADQAEAQRQFDLARWREQYQAEMDAARRGRKKGVWQNVLGSAVNLAGAVVPGIAQAKMMKDYLSSMRTNDNSYQGTDFTGWRSR
ncbi:MAG: hypothetical protein A3F67_05145 [Verrucomicrobia bacterium RIFCSPHIGHO2_12_FULL_41_10]|nr:MAG: hypothetical protein A3F67_05145 [Verrucomicrobia bacterium RIFCSPHIGHO2_12_FULL_41_10]